MANVDVELSTALYSLALVFFAAYRNDGARIQQIHALDDGLLFAFLALQ